MNLKKAKEIYQEAWFCARANVESKKYSIDEIREALDKVSKHIKRRNEIRKIVKPIILVSFVIFMIVFGFLIPFLSVSVSGNVESSVQFGSRVDYPISWERNENAENLRCTISKSRVPKYPKLSCVN